jgi:S1/P1 Nuclease
LFSECAEEQGAGQSKTGRIYVIYLLMLLRKMRHGVTEVVIYVNDVLGFTDELGGTKLQVSFQGKEQTLHELWDTGLIETEKGSAREIAKRLNGEVSAEERKSWEAERLRIGPTNRAP